MAKTIGTNLSGAEGAPSRPLGASDKARRILSNALKTLVIWQERADQRHALAQLDDHMLKDIGVSRADAYKEIRKPFWLS